MLTIKQYYEWETSERKHIKGEKSDREVIKGELTKELLITDLERIHTIINQ